jgi:hypothetical protein
VWRGAGEVDGGGADKQPAPGRLGEGKGQRKRGAGGGRQGRWLWDVGELANLFFPHGALVTLSLAGTFKKAGGAGPTCYREEAS